MLVAAGTAFAASEIFKAIKSLYGVASDFNEFIDDHLEKMKGAENKAIARTGRVLEGAKQGFQLGYVSSVVIIATGQLILGNTLTAVTAAATAATLTNPIAMTCGAVGAVFYGWSALSETERTEILDRLSDGLKIGIELIKSLLRYVIDKTKELLSSENLEEIKKYVSSAARTFGNTLGGITHKISDIASDNFDLVLNKTSEALGKTKLTAAGVYLTAADSVDVAGETVVGTIEKTKGLANDARLAVAETAGLIAEKFTSKTKK